MLTKTSCLDENKNYAEMACEMSDDVCSRINREIDEWLVYNTEGTVVLLDVSEETVDKCTVHLLIGCEYEVKLHVPSGYPQCEDSFSVESVESVIQAWTKAMNEYFINGEDKLSLSDVLDKAVKLFATRNYACQKQSSEEDTDEDIDSDADNADVDDNVEESDTISVDEAFTTDWELKVARKKMKWSKREPIVREMMKQKRLEQGLEAQKKTLQQIFTSNAASGILTNDLVKIMECEETCGFSAEPIQDNIYKWRVRMSKFDPTCDLAKDLAEIKRQYNYDYIEMEMTFEIDLFPFYPPLVKVIRPRLQGCLMQRITNIELLQLSYWSPAKDMKSVIAEIKDFLQQWGHIDVNCDRNHIARCPYLDIEHYLLTLAQVSEVIPRANQVYKLDDDKIRELKSTAVLQMSKCKPGEKRSKEEYWAKGVGFGHNNRPGWDIDAYIAAQNEKDYKIESALKEILTELKALPTVHTSLQTLHTMKHKHTPGQSANTVQHSIVTLNTSQNNASCSVAGPITEVAGTSSMKEDTGRGDVLVGDVYSVLEGSSLIPCLENYLKVDSFLEISRHSVVYTVIVNVIRELAYRKQFLSLLCCLPGQEKSIYQLLEHLDKIASVMLKQIHKPANGALPDHFLQVDSSSDSSDTENKLDSKCLNTLLKKKWNTRSTPPPLHNKDGASSNASIEERLAREFIVLFKLVSHSVENGGLLNRCSCQPDSIPNGDVTREQIHIHTPSTGKSYTMVEAQYKEFIKSLQFQTCHIPVDGKHCHRYANQLSSQSCQSLKQQVIRIAQELSSLSTSLPLELSSSIFVRTDDEKISLMQALITGPEGTPYSSGCYVFDIHFPATYPLRPPQVNLRTTGNGTVRFNPNLYNCGTVCLSLLGTWQGQNGEEWNITSTILQVLVSIQSLILVPDPYFNEPGYEQSINTDSGKAMSQEYNKGIQIHNINHAMVGQLQHPTPGFEEVIKTHFYVKKDLILQEVKDWVKENKCSKLETAFSQLKKELKKLEPPAALLSSSKA